MVKGSEFVEFVLESLEPLRGVSARRMFGGRGIYKDGVMFALIAGDQLYLKADDGNRPAFEARGLQPFTYTAKRRPIQMSYYEAPGEGLDDPEILCDWAQGAYAAALRARKAKRR
jgi:DNA transformation protein and related proteins